MDSLKSGWNSLTGSRNNEEGEGLFGTSNTEGSNNTKEQLCGYFTLTKKQRLYGFIYAFCIGLGLSILGIILLAVGSVVGFAVCYSLGTLCALASSGFLWGPVSQLKSMFKETRWLTTLIMLVFVALTLMAAFWWDSAGLCFLFVFCQFLAWIWYCLSYIPFARRAVTSCLKGILGGC